MSGISSARIFENFNNNPMIKGTNLGAFNHGVLNDEMIRILCDKNHNSHPMIAPYEGFQIKKMHDPNDSGNRIPIISYGQSSHGYDIRCGNEFKIFSNANATRIDPKRINENVFVKKDGSKEEIWIPPNSYALTHSLERFDLPRDIVGIAVGKSTYARAGIIINVTPLEAGWEGFLTIEIANGTTLPAKIYPGEGISQIIFHKSLPCNVSYADRSGKYMHQGAEVVLAKV